LGENTFHHRCVRRDDEIVLVHAHRVVAFFLQHADDTEGNGVETHHLADGVGAVGEEIIDHRLAENTYLGIGLDVLLGEKITIAHRELAYVQVVLIDPIDGRLGIVVTVDKLSVAAHHRTDALDIRTLILETLIVGELQCLHRRGVLSHASTHVGTRMDHDHV